MPLRDGHKKCLAAEGPGAGPSSAKIAPLSLSAACFASRAGHSEQPEVNEDSHLVLPVAIRCGARTLRARAMLDLGATADFVDKQWCRRVGLSLVAKASPIPLQTIDGSPIRTGDVTHETETLPIEVAGRVTQVCLNVTGLGGYNIILGHSWLVRNNPEVDWMTGEICWSSERAIRPAALTAASGRPQALAIRMMARADFGEWDGEGVGAMRITTPKTPDSPSPPKNSIPEEY